MEPGYAMDIRRKRADSTPGPRDWFTGQVRMDEIAAPVPPSRTRVLSGHFAPGARTAWHRHPFGQILHVTEGAGLVQSRGGEPEAIRAGDTVQAAAGEWHWHGAGPGTFMTHLAVQEADGDGRTSEWASTSPTRNTWPDGGEPSRSARSRALGPATFALL
jgi:quercetin dioxygenase-like cupin family protein